MTDTPSPDFSAFALPDGSVPGGIATPELIASLLADGDDDLAAWAVGQALAEQPRAAVYDDVLRRAMELVGTRWETGQWTIPQEHLATVALVNALARLRPADGPESRIGPLAILAAPAGEQHVAGLVCLAQVLEEAGWRAENLGANVPADDLVLFVSARDVQLVALSIGTQARVPALQETVDALRAAGGALESLPILVGGHGIEGVEAAVTGADLVSASLTDAEQYVRSLARWPNPPDGPDPKSR